MKDCLGDALFAEDDGFAPRVACGRWLDEGERLSVFDRKAREHTARPVLPKAPGVLAKALKPRLVLIFELRHPFVWQPFLALFVYASLISLSKALYRI